MVYKRELTSRQEEIYELIKSLHDSGLGYRRIAKRLRDMNIKTARGSVFKNNNVFAVIKRYEERQVRIKEERNRKYEHKWGKMYLTFCYNTEKNKANIKFETQIIRFILNDEGLMKSDATVRLRVLLSREYLDKIQIGLLDM